MTPRRKAILAGVPADDEKDPVLEALWVRVLEAWDDERTHAAAIDHGARNELLPELASRYRALVGDAQKGAVAQKKLDAIVVAATTLLFSQKTPAAGKVPLPITLSAFGICAVLLLWLTWALWGKR
ncbi:MAG: hypothetical protein ACLP1X_24140 [Polyangiaceae bacterium]|jgi:hypothetical protein